MSDEAVLEGAAVEGRYDKACIPIDLSAIYQRVDQHLRANCNSALVAVEMPQSDSLATRQYWLYEARLEEGAKIREIELVSRARELNCLAPFEVPLAHWWRAPSPY